MRCRFFSTMSRVRNTVFTHSNMAELMDNSVLPSQEVRNKNLKKELASSVAKSALLTVEPYKTLTPTHYLLFGRMDSEHSKKICEELFQYSSSAAYAAGEKRFQAYQPVPREVSYFLGPFKTGLSHLSMTKGKAREQPFAGGAGLEASEGDGIAFADRHGVEGVELDAALRILPEEHHYVVTGKEAQRELLECAFNTHLLQAFLFKEKVQEFYKERALEFNPNTFKGREFLANAEQLEQALISGKLDRLKELSGLAPASLRSMLEDSIAEAETILGSKKDLSL